MGILSNEISSIYNDYHPAFKNLYKIEIYPGTSESVTEDIKTYIGLHATSVMFNGETLNMERNEVTKNFQLSGGSPYQRTNELTITWREDEFWKVKEYHDDWLECLYDRDSDCFISYPLNPNETVVRDLNSNNIYKNIRISRNDLFRNIKITLPDHLSKDAVFIEFNSILPKNTGGIDLGWGSSSDIIRHSISYYVTEWKVYSKKRANNSNGYDFNNLNFVSTKNLLASQLAQYSEKKYQQERRGK